MSTTHHPAEYRKDEYIARMKRLGISLSKAAKRGFTIACDRAQHQECVGHVNLPGLYKTSCRCMCHSTGRGSLRIIGDAPTGAAPAMVACEVRCVECTRRYRMTMSRLGWARNRDLEGRGWVNLAYVAGWNTGQKANHRAGRWLCPSCTNGRLGLPEGPEAPETEDA